MLGKRAKRNRITKRLEQNFNEKSYEIIQDGMEDEDPSLKIQTKDRIIVLSVSEDGNVIEDFRMRRGAGTKEAFLKKQAAFREIENFVAKTYKKDATVTKKSFDDSYIKVKTSEKNITVTYDFSQKEVVVKERRRKGLSAEVKSEPKTPLVKESSITQKASTAEKPITEDTSIPDVPAKEKVKKRKPTFKEGSLVKPIYSPEVYIVIEDCGNVIRVERNSATHMIAASDLIAVEQGFDN